MILSINVEYLLDIHANNSWKALTNGEVNLYEHITTEDRYSTSTQIHISYRCGVTNKINGFNSDYYETELEIYLRPVPWP